MYKNKYQNVIKRFTEINTKGLNSLRLFSYTDKYLLLHRLIKIYKIRF